MFIETAFTNYKSIDVWKEKGVFIETAFTKNKKMYEMCDFHAAREYHKDAIAVCDAFVVTMSGKQEMLVQLRERAREAIQINRKKLRSIYHRDNCLVWSSEY